MDRTSEECGPVPRPELMSSSGRRWGSSLLGWLATHRRGAALLAAPLLTVSLVWAQDAPKGGRREGDLQTFINPEASDLNTKLEVLQQALFEVNQKLTNLTFMQRYGDRIRMDRVMYPNSEHGLTPGYVFTPVRAEREKRYPGLVAVHGGYHFSLDEEFFGFIERAVSEGYAVIFPEYRGSRGYGAEHYKAQDYGGKDVDDVLDAADYLASRAGVDPARLAIMGRSRGGMIALLAIERSPKKFRAAVDVVGITDFVAYMSYKPEYRRQDVAKTARFGGTPFENLPAYLDASPLTHVDRIETPLLILATTHDRTVPVQLHTERLIDALKARGKTFEAKIYDRAPGGHGFSQGDSEPGRDSADRIFAFLAKHLKSREEIIR
jgi:dipeptidyl aminopeptidase/acylaminoacyl peptidase